MPIYTARIVITEYGAPHRHKHKIEILGRKMPPERRGLASSTSPNNSSFMSMIKRE
jgi:hypothetical protein